jgi:DNA-binding transcriptional MocR family regulator
MTEGFSDPRKYLRIAEDLRAQIAGGTLAPGEPIPSITIMQDKYGISRQTIAKGLRILEREGLLCRVRGEGYYVPSESLAPLIVPPRGLTSARHAAAPGPGSGPVRLDAVRLDATWTATPLHGYSASVDDHRQHAYPARRGLAGRPRSQLFTRQRHFLSYLP